MGTLLRDTSLTAEQTSYVEAISSSGEALLGLIDEVLDFSRIEAGRLELRPLSTRLELLAERVVELLAPRAQAKGLDIACYVSPDVPDEVLVDAPRLRQVLINLAGNGIKFTDRGGVLIEILRADAEAPETSGRRGAGAARGAMRLSARVHDTGIGPVAGGGIQAFHRVRTGRSRPPRAATAAPGSASPSRSASWRR